MIHLIALTGLSYEAKKRAAEVLASELTARQQSLTVIDNAETAMRLPFPTLRLPTGCVCCGAAFGLYHAISVLEKEAGDSAAILVTAASAMPEALGMIFAGIGSPNLQVKTVTLVEEWMSERAPYLLEQLVLHSDVAIAIPFSDEALIAAAL